MQEFACNFLSVSEWSRLRCIGIYRNYRVGGVAVRNFRELVTFASRLHQNAKLPPYYFNCVIHQWEGWTTRSMFLPFDWKYFHLSWVLSLRFFLISWFFLSLRLRCEVLRHLGEKTCCCCCHNHLLTPHFKDPRSETCWKIVWGDNLLQWCGENNRSY